MLRRTALSATTILLAFSLMAGPAFAQGGPPAPDGHPHVLLINADNVIINSGVQSQPPELVSVDFDRCIELANGRPLLKPHAHHYSVHLGSASEALQRAGHLVWSGTCAQFDS